VNGRKDLGCWPDWPRWLEWIEPRRSNALEPPLAPGHELVRRATNTPYEQKGLPMNHTRLSPEKPAIVSSPRAWLDAFPPHKRSSIVNLFHYAVRAGATTPEATRMKVWQEVRQRLTSERDTDTASHLGFPIVIAKF
jgi:hypothetical protein